MSVPKSNIWEKAVVATVLLTFFCLFSCVLPGIAAKKAAPRRTGAQGGGGGGVYPQFRFGGQKVVRWIPEQMPLHVYISHGLCLDELGVDPANGGPLSNIDNTSGWPDLVSQAVSNPDAFNNMKVAENYNEQMWQAAAQGINQWKKFSAEGLYNFELTNNPEEADIFVFWTHHFVNKLGLGLFANDIRGYTAKYMLPYGPVMSALQQGQTDRIQFKPVVVVLRTSDTTGVPMPLGKLVAASAHEMGHVLGIDGHSANPHDLMSVYYGNGTVSANDAATIRYLYKLRPDLLP
ncbi:MAG: matrixin family metalloprotease [Candidatus Obscuribacterales bacterium]|nr:matrixin family metalloprotease [Candidatus Obscuribacterales bacterium]